MFSRIIFCLLLAICLALHIVYAVPAGHGPKTSWNSYSYFPDSASYIPPYDFLHAVRPPGYPLFIASIASVSKWDPKIAAHPTNQTISNQPQSEFLKVVRAQKLIFLFAIALFAFALMTWIMPVIVAVGIAALYYFGFYSAEIDSVLTETLAQSVLMIVAAVTIYILRTPRSWLLVPLAILCAYAYHVRPASAFTVLFFITAAARVVYYHGMRALPLLGFAVTVFTGLFLAPGLYRAFQGGNFQSSGIYPDLKIQVALQIADPGDIELMSDEQSRFFLRRALERKPIEDARMAGSWDEEALRIGFPYLTTNLYYNAFAVSNQMGLDADAARELYSRVAAPILRKHWTRYLELSARSFWYALTRQTRLHLGNWLPFPALALAYLMLAAILGGVTELFAITCLCAHLAHVAIVCSHDQPITRYIFATEFLVLVGAALLLYRITVMALAAFQTSWSSTPYSAAR